MTMLRKLTVLAFFFGFAGIAGADNLDMDGTNNANGSVGPASGSTQASVESTYGSPNAKKAAVGDPPISSWEYDGFVVFFEYDRVIHTVKKR
ncbi:MAG: hypothetical protein ACR2QT_14190 [Woeseiaceae bacterium]